MMLNRVAITIKVGDNPPYYDGDIVDFISEKEWGRPIEDIFSANHKRVFAVLIINPALTELANRALAPVYETDLVDALGAPVGPLKYGRSAFVKLDEIAQRLGMPDLVNQLRSTVDTVPILDCSSFGLDMFYSRRQNGVRADLLPDLNAVSSGSKTVGSGGDYATFAAAGADIAATLTGNLTFTQISAITETASTNPNKALAGYTLTFTSDTDPKGDFNKGWLLTQNINDYCFNIVCSSASAGAKIVFSKLKTKYTNSGIAGKGNICSFTGSTTNIVWDAHDIICDTNGINGFVIRFQAGANTVMKAYNIVSGNSSGTKAGGTAIHVTGSASSIYENMTARNCAIGFSNYANTTITATNVACFDNTKDFSYGSSSTAGLGNTTASKCASSDTTGSEAGLRSLSSSSEFVSTDITSANFMKVKAGGQCQNGGTTTAITANTYGIRGNTRPRSSSYSIGADEFAASGCIPKGIFF